MDEEMAKTENETSCWDSSSESLDIILVRQMRD